jgi:NAD(P)-dependent dehydrogenase (short-subunit alcohol dehydrogenase family)
MCLCASLLAGIGIGVAAAMARRRKKFSFIGRTIVITGGSRGLGLVMAREFLREGARVALLARDRDELTRAEADLSNPRRVLAIPCDIRQKEQVDKAIAIVAEHFGRIDVLVNNAGIIQVGPMDHMTVSDFEEALAVHLFGPLYTTLAVLPHMRAIQQGRIVNITSVGGKIAVPHLLPYTVSKFALVGLSDGLRAELRRENICVTTVCPGLMRTGSPGNALFKGKHRQEYAWFAVSDSLPVLSMHSSRAARRIIEACRHGSARIILGTHTKAAILLNEAFPGATTHLLDLANRWLPKNDNRAGDQAYTGWESESRWAPSILTRLTDKAAVENNEIKPAF